MGQVLPHAYTLVGQFAESLPKCQQVLCLAQRIVPPGEGADGAIQLAMVGRWHHPEYGEFEITEADIDAAIQAFSQQDTPPMMDWNHGSTVKGATAEQGKASGWIRSIVKRGTGAAAQLWADVVEWTEEAANAIRKGEYAFSSPVLLRNVKDRKTGEEVRMRLFNAALTNTPFLDGMAAAKLSEVLAERASSEDDEEEPEASSPAADTPPPAAAPPAPPSDAEAPEAEDAEGDEEGATPPEGVQEGTLEGGAQSTDAVIAMVDALAKAVDVDRAYVVDLMTRHMDGFAKACREILDREQQAASNQNHQVSMSETNPNVEAEARIAALESQQKERDTIALSERVVALEESNKKRAQEAAEARRREIEARVDGLVAKGYVHASQRADAIWAFTEFPERAANMYKLKVVPVGDSQAGDSDPHAPAAKADPGAPAVKLSEVSDPDIKRAARTIMGVTNQATGLKFTEVEAIQKATAKVLTLRKAG